DKKAINKKTLESLVKAGAFDNLEANRATLFNNIGRLLDEVNTILQNENQALGFYFSASLFDEYRDVVHKLGINPLSHYSTESDEMQDLINGASRERQKVLVCGIINYMGSRPLKKGGKMNFINIEDDSGSLEFIVYDT